MKATYNAPKMEISYFKIENVITTSGGTTSEPTAFGQAENLLKSNGIVTEKTFTFTI